jgi:CRISPR/Cas system endoribonuclease Cas6 (RAMP superfamily)
MKNFYVRSSLPDGYAIYYSNFMDIDTMAYYSRLNGYEMISDVKIFGGQIVIYGVTEWVHFASKDLAQQLADKWNAILLMRELAGVKRNETI